MEAREKADDSASRRMSYSRRAEFVHACPKLDRRDVQRWIKEFEGTVVKMLSGIPHIQEALHHQIINEESTFPASVINTKLVPTNALNFTIFERACESDSFVMIQIWGQGICWVNELIKLLLLDDLIDSQVRQGESINQFIDRMNTKFLEASLAGVRTSEQERMDILANGIKSAHPIIYASLRSLMGHPYKSIAVAAHGRELLSDVPSDESEGEKLDRRIKP